MNTSIITYSIGKQSIMVKTAAKDCGKNYIEVRPPLVHRL